MLHPLPPPPIVELVLSLTFEWGSGLEMSVFADANYAEKADGRRSVSGVVVTVGKSCVSWFSSTQKILSGI